MSSVRDFSVWLSGANNQPNISISRGCECRDSHPLRHSLLPDADFPSLSFYYVASSVALTARPTMTISLVVTQVCAAIFLLVATVVCGVCPAWIGHYVASRRRKRACDDSHSCLQCPLALDDDSKPQQSEMSQKILSFLMNFGGKCVVLYSLFVKDDSVSHTHVQEECFLRRRSCTCYRK